jgi:structure-specific endonuclease subunit SLX1
MTTKEAFVYLVGTEDGKHTYVGASPTIDRRLRQHRGEIKGGAKATARMRAKGRLVRFAHVKGFPDWTAALQFEWAWKDVTRACPGKTSVDRRQTALDRIFQRGYSTSKAVPFAEWPTWPEVVWETNPTGRLTWEGPTGP